MPIELGNSWFSPKCIEVQRHMLSDRGRDTGWDRGPPGLPNPTKLRMRSVKSVAVRQRGISFVVERETAQTAS